MFHSLLGDVRPCSIRDHTSGGHLLIPELKAALLDIGEIEHLGNGFLDIGIKYAGKESANFIKKTYFPAETSMDQAVEIIEKSLKNSNLVEFIGSDVKKSFKITYPSGQIFMVHIENTIARLYPINPRSLLK